MNKMDKKLRILFEYQKFENNEHLNNVIFDSQEETSSCLLEDALFSVTGGISEEEKNKDEEK